MLSIVIPSFNAAEYIGEMIESFIMQSNSDWEMIIVDDGSTDNTLDIVYKYSQQDKRIRLFKRDRSPKGANTCRNIGMQKAQGEYLSILDADDKVSSTFVEKRVNFMREHSELDFAVFPARYFKTTGLLSKFDESMIFGKRPKNEINVLIEFLKADYPFTIWTNIYKKSSLDGILWDEKVAVLQDWDFNVAVLLNGLKFKFSNSDECDYYYRKDNANSVCSNYSSPVKAESTLYLAKKTLEIIKTMPDEYHKAFFSFLLVQLERFLRGGASVQHTSAMVELISAEYGKKYRLRFIVYMSKLIKPIPLRIKTVLTLYKILHLS